MHITVQYTTSFFQDGEGMTCPALPLIGLTLIFLP